MNTSVTSYRYDRQDIQAGILHIGVGNFHRAHQAFYTNQVLESPDQRQWGICGVALLPSDEALVRKLTQQKGEYSLTVCGREGQDQVYVIGALIEVIWGVSDPEAVLNKMADEAIRILTLTITEGGYNLDKATQAFNFEHEGVKHDLAFPAQPQTVFGFVAEGLRRRKAAGHQGLTILSCDNLQHNGHTTRKAFLSFIEAQDASLAEWVKSHVTFPNSMVDRITPVTLPEDVQRLNTRSGLNDQVPVYCEDFIQWVIEDDFMAGRPAWERVGVEFTADVSAYETMKLSLLNASHTLLSYPAFLAGYRKVDDAMHDPVFVQFVRNFMDRDVTPYVPAPGNTNLELYKQTLVERFANRSVSDQLSRLCFDGISKFPVYILPNLAHMIRDQKDLTRLAFLFASYRHYLKYKTDDSGQTFDIAEPWLTTEDERVIASEDPVEFLGLSAFQSLNLESVKDFVGPYRAFAKRIQGEGVKVTLESILH
ncbi:mannitol dehydrogenase [Siphonobacter sp. BAB-5405]|uniref:mannitol dehydrogenase family protein n=1 Tax=Siphonobacter sp. BAB-5405 TaxID=1864825 RepID=UPI000C80CBD6|nr:mannitol dehydrogenase family protein [Siphonobacter sp. BAB-5405]PMD90200.1 mannitol dehydrogenase [Siphonobacter sp. BAB-5405]